MARLVGVTVIPQRDCDAALGIKPECLAPST
jgi:hypothetical protein